MRTRMGPVLLQAHGAHGYRLIVFCFREVSGLIRSIVRSETFGPLTHGFDHFLCQLNLRLQAGEGCDFAVLGFLCAQGRCLCLQALKLV